MMTQRIVRWSGLVALVTGLVWVIYEFGEIAGMISPLLDPRLDLFSHSLIGLAAIGLYTRIAERAGLYGLVAMVGYLVMVLVNTSVKAIYSVVVPVLAAQHPEAGTAVGSTAAWGLLTTLWLWLTILAPIAYGAMMFRSAVYPRWAAVLLITGPVVSMTVGPLITTALGLGGNVGAALSAAGWAWLGYAAWSRETVAEASITPQAAAA